MYAYVHPLGSDNIMQAFINHGTLYAMVKTSSAKIFNDVLCQACENYCSYSQIWLTSILTIP